MKEMNEKPLNKVTRRGGTAHTSLDHLAGTWSAEEAKAFARRTAAFEMVDEELWKWSPGQEPLPAAIVRLLDASSRLAPRPRRA